jgi:Hemerythrin HHE cation binding domain
MWMPVRRFGGRDGCTQPAEEDHDKVKKLLEDLDSTTERGVKTREQLFSKIKQELEIHEAIEEEIFYPALKDHPKTKELTLEAYEEHHVVDLVVAEIEAIPFDGEAQAGADAAGFGRLAIRRREQRGSGRGLGPRDGTNEAAHGHLRT